MDRDDLLGRFYIVEGESAGTASSPAPGPTRWPPSGAPRASRGGAIVNHPTIAQSHRILAAANVAICPVTLHQRIAHSHAFNSGRYAAETEPGTKAAVELVQLYDWLVSARALPQPDTKETA